MTTTVFWKYLVRKMIRKVVANEKNEKTTIKVSTMSTHRSRRKHSVRQRKHYSAIQVWQNLCTGVENFDNKSCLTSTDITSVSLFREPVSRIWFYEREAHNQIITDWAPWIPTFGQWHSFLWPSNGQCGIEWSRPHRITSLKYQWGKQQPKL